MSTVDLRPRRRCEKCKHWRKSNTVWTWLGSDEKSERFHPCNRAENTGGTVDEQSKMIAWDSEGYYATLLTAFDFCCIQFEVKE